LRKCSVGFDARGKRVDVAEFFAHALPDFDVVNATDLDHRSPPLSVVSILILFSCSFGDDRRGDHGGRLLVGARQQMRVGLEDGRGIVAEPRGDHVKRHSLGECDRRVRVPQDVNRGW
jgi:hypothetical protein